MSVPRTNEQSPPIFSRAEVWSVILELRVPPQMAVNVSATVTDLVPKRVLLSTTRWLEEQQILHEKYETITIEQVECHKNIVGTRKTVAKQCVAKGVS